MKQLNRLIVAGAAATLLPFAAAFAQQSPASTPDQSAPAASEQPQQKGTTFESLEHATGRIPGPLRRRGWAGHRRHPAQSDRRCLACPRGGPPERAALRLSRGRPLRPGPGNAVQSEQAAGGPLCQGLRRENSSIPTTCCSPMTAIPRRRISRWTRATMPRRFPKRIAWDDAFDWQGDARPGYPQGKAGDLRSARQRVHGPCLLRGPASRHLSRLHREDPVSQGTGGQRRGAASRA